MRRLWTLAMLMGALAATAETNYVWIPYLHPGATQWWTNIYALPDEVTNWQGWQAVNENFRRTSNAIYYGSSAASQTPLTADVNMAGHLMTNGTVSSTNTLLRGRTHIHPINTNIVDWNLFTFGGSLILNEAVTNVSLTLDRTTKRMTWPGMSVFSSLSLGTNEFAIQDRDVGAVVLLSGSNVLRFQTNAVTALVPLYGNGVGLTNVQSSSISGLGDAQTNAMLRSGTWVSGGTNWLYVSANTTNILSWTFTNFAGMSYYATLGTPTLLWSTDSGVTWNNGAATLVTNVPVKLAVFGGGFWGTTNNPTSLNGDVGLTNVLVYSLSRGDLWGNTNQIIGQSLRVGTPVDPNDAVPKFYADLLAGQVGQLNAVQEGQLNGYGLHLDSAWNLYSASSNNALTAVFLGAQSWAVTYPTPLAVTNTISATVANRTNATVKVATNGLATAPVLQISHYLKPLNWTYLSATPTNSGTNWVFSFVIPYTDSAFVAPVIQSPNPGVFRMATVLQLTPRTVTNASDSTWGNGSGMVCCDSNYVYVSVGSNVWKRSALSSW